MSNISYCFENKTVLITGASRGIGKATAKLFAGASATLILTELEQSYQALLDFSQELEQEYGIKVYPYILDIKNLSQIKDTIQKVLEDVKSIDILVNNAGVNNLNKATMITEEEWDNILDTNLKGTFFITQEVGKHMILSKSGCIVSVSSQHGVVGNELRAHYCSSKAGIINMTKAISFEWSGYGIRVNSVSPTFVINENNHMMLMQKDNAKKCMNKIPLKKYATPIDIAHAIAFLSSDEAQMITGINLLVDGGWTAV